MKKIISAKDFILLVWALPYKSYIQKLHLLVAYANFLSQKLELWMFVPCKFVDGFWVVLEEPKKEEIIFKNKPILFDAILKEYQEAKNRVLFEGFEIGNSIALPETLSVRNEKLKRTIFVCNSMSIEDLVKYNLELTPTAQKQIGL